MSLKFLVRELRELKDGIWGENRGQGKHWRNRARSHIAPVEAPSEPTEQSKWADMPPELLLDIIGRVEESETSWPARNAVISCASVCNSWRDVTKEIVQTPEECGRLTFPVSLKQPGPRNAPIQCFIRRDRKSSTFLLYCGLAPSEDGNDKLLLAAKKIRRATCTEFVITLVADNFSRSSSTYIGKLRSNFMGTKFKIYDNQSADDAMAQSKSKLGRRLHTTACNYHTATISYELNVLRTRGPRRMNCDMHSIPISSIQEGGTAPTPISLPISVAKTSSSLVSRRKAQTTIDCSSSKFPSTKVPSSEESMILKNKAPRWHEQLQCWCLNFKGRVTVASVKNFQLVAAVDPSHNVSDAEQERVILQFGKIGRDIFTMDYSYPISAFHAFAICLSSFDTKPACE
ncbi:Tubby-like F-box protein 5 [Heracleum sosnowskyi]|uniref:Tubby-like F-box protein n=1 Tax=Heracleum sosnowskyi TaxID=360622 RepID=A0AAD8M345_9APIA|nr:Tubby-like F-box protein 5 [Heracleum sosnowskyi]